MHKNLNQRNSNAKILLLEAETTQVRLLQKYHGTPTNLLKYQRIFKTTAMSLFKEILRQQNIMYSHTINRKKH